jgi:hypothetical protein
MISASGPVQTLATRPYSRIAEPLYRCTTGLFSTTSFGRGTAAQTLDCFKQLTAVADGRDTQILEVFRRQFRQDSRVNFVLAESRAVPGDLKGDPCAFDASDLPAFSKQRSELGLLKGRSVKTIAQPFGGWT